LALLAKDVTRKFWRFWQKVSRPDEGRISRTQSALEQDYQNFCAKTREAGGLPTSFGFHLKSYNKQIFNAPKIAFFHRNSAGCCFCGKIAEL
jgi:hypothetical protein